MNSNLEKKFNDISLFLEEYKNFHDIEFLKRYPTPYPSPLSSWIEEMMDWSFKDIAYFESYPHEDLVRGNSFKEYLRKIREFTTIEKTNLDEVDLSDALLRKLNLKKKHEVKILKNYFSKISDKLEVVIDIGGGAGHLSCCLIEKTNLEAFCIDIDEKVQLSGQKKVSDWLPEKQENIKFINQDFLDNEKLRLDINYESALICGLHSCGELSTSILKFSMKNKIKSLINFGCCYHKLNNEYNISRQAKKKGVNFSNNALHLASRCGKIITEEDLRKRYHLKRYRYSLHYFLNDRYNLNFSPIGNAKTSDYELDFSDYAKKFHQGSELLDIDNNILLEFYNNEQVKLKVRENYIADTIRLLLGRVIELYIVLDRALYLGENGKNVKVLEVFDRRLSPRNIMITYSS